jgi:GGDEF domain-containing protein
MVEDAFADNDPRVLSPEVFDFVLNNELKRAIRSQNFLTLLVVEPVPRQGTGERKELARELAHVISRVVRETDILSPGADGRLSVVLLDADFQHSMLVVERLMARVEHYEFTTPAAVSIGVASCPTHGADLESLRSAAQAQPIDTRRAPRGSSNTQ